MVPGKRELIMNISILIYTVTIFVYSWIVVFRMTWWIIFVWIFSVSSMFRSFYEYGKRERLHRKLTRAISESLGYNDSGNEETADKPPGKSPDELEAQQASNGGIKTDDISGANATARLHSLADNGDDFDQDPASDRKLDSTFQTNSRRESGMLVC